MVYIYVHKKLLTHPTHDSGAVVDILQPLPERIKVGTVADYDPFCLALTGLTKAGREVSVL